MGDPRTPPPGRRYGTVDRPGAEPHDAWTCPISHPVKGAVNPGNSGERLFHVPGGASYELGMRELEQGIAIQPYSDG